MHCSTRSSQDGAARRTAGESSSGQCAAAHGRPRAVCNPATAAWSERTADWPSPERTADGPSPAGLASQCSAVIVWGERSARWSIRSLRETTAADSAVQSRLSADHATAVKWSHAPRAQLAQLEFPGCFACFAYLHVLHALQHPAVRGHFSTLQQQHGPIYTHACARAHTHHWHNWSDAMIDCRRVNRLRTGWCCCLCFCCQSDRDCKTCREAEDRC